MLNSEAMVCALGETDLSEWRLLELMRRYFSTATPKGKILKQLYRLKRARREKKNYE